MDKLVLIGGGGHCRSCIDVIELEGKFQIIGILDHKEQVGTQISGYPVVGNDDKIQYYIEKGVSFLITIGQIDNAEPRIRLYNHIKSLNGKLATVISPRAYITKTALIGEGTIVLHGALVNANAKVGDNCIINTKALIEHDSVILSHCHISTAAVVNGAVRVGEASFFGSNAVSRQGISIPANSFVRAGSCLSNNKVYKKVAFLTTIYPTRTDYVIDFFNSLSQQTYKNFDLIVVNDGFNHFDDIKKTYKDIKTIELNGAGSIAKNRESLIKFAKINDYDIAIFGDIDDTFCSDRVRRSVLALNENDIVVNELATIINGLPLGDSIYSNRISGCSVDIEFIRDKNIFGLSNTAINLGIVEIEDIRFDDKIIAVDWYFFSVLLIKGYKAEFIPDVKTFYRQHENNTIGIGAFTLDKLKRILKVKRIHYELLVELDETYSLQLNELELYEELVSADNCLEIVVRKNNSIHSPLWWELLKYRELK